MKYPKKHCKFCVHSAKYVDYKDVDLLKEYTTFFSRIQPRLYTGNCIRHQKMLARAIKNARIMALIPFVSR